MFAYHWIKTMQLKTYQQNTLGVLRRFFEQCRLTDVRSAYHRVHAPHKIGQFPPALALSEKCAKLVADNLEFRPVSPDKQLELEFVSNSESVF